MSNCVKWVHTESYTEKVRQLLTAFETSFDISNTGYVVSYVRADAVNITTNHIWNPYQLARFINLYPDIYIEIHAAAHNYFEVRLFCVNEHLSRELKRLKELMAEPKRNLLPPTSVRQKSPSPAGRGQG